MTNLAEWNEWYAKAAGIIGYANPDDVLDQTSKSHEKTLNLEEDEIQSLLPIPNYEFIEIERDYSDMNCVVKVDDKYFMLSGFYDSWNGTEWDDITWVEVEKKTRVEEYWSQV